MKNANHTDIIQTASGPVIGIIEGDYYAFKGIPYGKVRRFKPAQPFTWNEPFHATKYRTKAIHNAL